jgi:small conductance mechanosensitive channel
MTYRSLVTHLLVAFVLISSITIAIAQGEFPPGGVQPDTGPPSSKPSVTVVPAANDAAISQRLQGILESTGWFTAPRVSVRQGVVTVDGKTDSQEHKRWAGALAEKTQDVVAVVNRIEVVTDVGSTFGRAGEEIRGFYRAVVASWPLVVLALIILLITWLIARLVSFLARRFFESRVASPLLLTVVTRALSVPILLLGVYFILQVAGLTRLALTVLGGTGLLGIIIGFAFRDIAENFLASLLLSVRNPFRSGDLVEVANHRGIVLNLNTRSTILLTLDGSQVQIPNATVYKSTIENFSSNPTRRATYSVGIGYDSSAAAAQKLISQVLREHPAVLDSPEPLVLVGELGAATVNLCVSYWFDSGTHSPARINSALLRQTKNALVKHGIELPDPAREVVFPRGIPVTMMRDEIAPEANRPPAPPSDGRAPLSADEASDATDGEGNLSTEANEIDLPAECTVVEAKENFLKS